MSRYSIFCLRDELERWLKELCAHRDLAGIVFSGEQPTVTKFQGNLPNDTYRAFFFRATNGQPVVHSLNDVRARPWGWLDVRPGGLRTAGGERLLLITQIAADDTATPEMKPSRHVQWLKRHTSRVVTRGVVATNIVTNKEAEYDDIYYTERAMHEFERGVVWKQSDSDRIVFAPKRANMM